MAPTMCRRIITSALVICLFAILDTTQAKSILLTPPDHCPTKDGQQCSFPFIYFGKQYDGCIKKDNETTSWCATKVDEKGNYVGIWAYCSPNCPENGECSSNQFRCDENNCIDSSLVCNGATECKDHSDEVGCDCLKQGDLSCGAEGLCVSPEDYCLNDVPCMHMRGEVDCRHLIATTEANEIEETETTFIPMTDSPVVKIHVDNNGVINSLKNANISHAQPLDQTDHVMHPTEMTSLLESTCLLLDLLSCDGTEDNCISKMRYCDEQVDCPALDHSICNEARSLHFDDIPEMHIAKTEEHKNHGAGNHEDHHHGSVDHHINHAHEDHEMEHHGDKAHVHEVDHHGGHDHVHEMEHHGEKAHAHEVDHHEGHDHVHEMEHHGEKAHAHEVDQHEEKINDMKHGHVTEQHHGDMIKNGDQIAMTETHEEVEHNTEQTHVVGTDDKMVVEEKISVEHQTEIPIVQQDNHDSKNTMADHEVEISHTNIPMEEEEKPIIDEHIEKRMHNEEHDHNTEKPESMSHHVMTDHAAAHKHEIPHSHHDVKNQDETKSIEHHSHIADHDHESNAEQQSDTAHTEQPMSEIEHETEMTLKDELHSHIGSIAEHVHDMEKSNVPMHSEKLILPEEKKHEMKHEVHHEEHVPVVEHHDIIQHSENHAAHQQTEKLHDIEHTNVVENEHKIIEHNEKDTQNLEHQHEMSHKPLEHSADEITHHELPDHNVEHQNDHAHADEKHDTMIHDEKLIDDAKEHKTESHVGTHVGEQHNMKHSDEHAHHKMHHEHKDTTHNEEHVAIKTEHNETIKMEEHSNNEKHETEKEKTTHEEMTHEENIPHDLSTHKEHLNTEEHSEIIHEGHEHDAEHHDIMNKEGNDHNSEHHEEMAHLEVLEETTTSDKILNNEEDHTILPEDEIEIIAAHDHKKMNSEMKEEHHDDLMAIDPEVIMHKNENKDHIEESESSNKVEMVESKSLKLEESNDDDSSSTMKIYIPIAVIAIVLVAVLIAWVALRTSRRADSYAIH